MVDRLHTQTQPVLVLVALFYTMGNGHRFLDTKSRLVGNEIGVDLHANPTDKHKYRGPSF